MAELIQTTRGPLSLEDALNDQSDVLPSLTALQQLRHFRDIELEARRTQLQDVIARHLGIPSTKFVLSPSSEWIYGSFNICLPIDIHDTLSGRLPRKALLRIAMPHAVGESNAPGAVDEKVRCEAATYVWLERECPSIPIPRLLGIGFPGSRSFSRVETESWLNRLVWQIRRAVAWFRGYTLPGFVAHDRATSSDLGYLLIEFIEDGAMLSSSWSQVDDPQKRKNLYSSLAKIMLDLSKVPLPRIGSWTMQDNGSISLTNRPLHDLTAFWNQQGIPVNIAKDLTYTSTDTYVRELLAFQDTRMRQQPNSILYREDGIGQLAALVGLRAVFPLLFDTRRNSGQFIMHFADMHQSNIFVDEEWKITRLIDLEFAYSCPVELVHVPHWLTGRGVDQLYGPHKEHYKLFHDEFVEAVADRETATQQDNKLSQRLADDWLTGRIWYSIALGSQNAFPALFERHLQPRYSPDWKFSTHAWPLAQLWSEDVSEFIDAKVDGLQAYNDKVRQLFREVAESQRASSMESAQTSCEDKQTLPCENRDEDHAATTNADVVTENEAGPLPDQA